MKKFSFFFQYTVYIINYFLSFLRLIFTLIEDENRKERKTVTILTFSIFKQK